METRDAEDQSQGCSRWAIVGEEGRGEGERKGGRDGGMGRMGGREGEGTIEG